MKPDWDRLMGDYAAHKTALVADVDCTAAGKPLCDSNGVKGFPSIKYGDPAALEDYKGGRKYDDLAKFAKENLKPLCSPANLDLCDATQKAEIDKIMAMSDSEIDEAIKTKEAQVADAEAKFKSGTDELQAKYKKLQADKESIVNGVKKGSLGVLKQVKADNKDRPKCKVAAPTACSEKEKAFIEKMTGKTDIIAKQITRLQKMKGGAMKPELKLWLIQRLNILQQLAK